MSMPLDDATLLQRWTARRDAEAFDAIVDRFAHQVYGTCRRILRNDADAEDVAQECFFALSRAAGEVHTSLGGWLHRVATCKSRDRIRVDARRRLREHEYGAAGRRAVVPDCDDILEHVDAAIESLPETTREVIVAHFLGRKTHVEIASELGVSRRAVSYRIERGLESIRQDLGRRGVTCSAAVLGASLAADASAAPASLMAILGKLAIVAGTTGGAGGATVTGSLLGSLSIVKAKITIVCATGFVLVAGIAYQFTCPFKVAPMPPPVDNTRALEPLGAASEVQDKPERDAEETPTDIADTGGDESPTLAELLALSNSALDRELNHYAPIEDPAQQASISGMVFDHDGYPIAGALVLLTPASHWGKLPRVDELSRAVSTGADGAYIMDPIENTGSYWVNATKPGYADGARGATMDAEIQIKPGTHATGIDFTLDAGPTLRGRVLSTSGTPVPDAIVQGLSVIGPQSPSSMQKYAARTNIDGYFTMGFQESALGAVASLRVRSTRYGSKAFSDVVLQEDQLIVLRLSAPSVLYGTVRFSNGGPVPGARLNFHGSKEVMAPYEGTGTPTKQPSFAGTVYAVCDHEGRYAVEVDAGLDFEVEAAGGGVGKNEKRDRITALEPGEHRAYDAVLDADSITVRGRLIGQPSGAPFESYVYFVEVVGRSEDGREAGRTGMNVDGSYELTIPGVPGRYTFQATYDFRSPLAGEESAPQDFDGGEERELDLTLPEPQYFSVRVVDSSGAPAPGAILDFESHWGGFATNESTNAEGRLDKPFAMPPEAGSRVVVNKPGYASASGTLYEDQSPGTVHPEEVIVLRLGAGFEGDLVDGEGRPLADTAVTITVTNGKGEQWPIGLRSDASGHFTVVDEAPADVVDISISMRDGGGAWGGEHVPLEANAITGLGQITLE